MNFTYATTFRVCSALMFLLLFFLIVSSSAAQVRRSQKSRLCIDTESNVVRIRKRCKEPKFVEVTAEQLAPTVELVTESFDMELDSTDDTSGRSISCPEGKVVTGGGASVVDNLGLNMKTSIPRIALDGWSASVTALRNNASGTLNIYAICSTGISIYEEESE